jgi:DNA-directed RNA polymerase sigma subunit (sigma70/sigma32)
MNLWEQYNPETLGAVLGAITSLPLTQCSEKALFGALKRHLTRKELRCWVMAQSGKTVEAIAEETGLASDDIEKALQKAGKKLRQPKLQQEFRTLLTAADEEA